MLGIVLKVFLCGYLVQALHGFTNGNPIANICQHIIPCCCPYQRFPRISWQKRDWKHTKQPWFPMFLEQHWEEILLLTLKTSMTPPPPPLPGGTLSAPRAVPREATDSGTARSGRSPMTEVLEWCMWRFPEMGGISKSSILDREFPL